MPIPIVVAAVAFVKAMTARFAAMTFIEKTAAAIVVYDLWDNGLREDVEAYAVKMAADTAGLVLDPDEPFTDASFSNAISQRTGIAIRSIRDQQMIKEDLDTYAAGLVSERSGYHVRSVSNVPVLKEDLQRIACAVLTERLGIPAGVMPADGELFNPEAIKQRLLSWAKAELFARVGEDIGVQISEIMAAGDMELVAAEINALLKGMDSGFEVTGRKMAVFVANRLATKSVTEYQAVAAGDTKKTRRQLQVKIAQQRFRAVHGNRQKYIPLGFTVTYNPPPPPP